MKGIHSSKDLDVVMKAFYFSGHVMVAPESVTHDRFLLIYSLHLFDGINSGQGAAKSVETIKPLSGRLRFTRSL